MKANYTEHLSKRLQKIKYAVGYIDEVLKQSRFSCDPLLIALADVASARKNPPLLNKIYDIKNRGYMHVAEFLDIINALDMQVVLKPKD